MVAGRIRHWKHGWIPVSPEAKAYAAGRGPRPVTSSGVQRRTEKAAPTLLKSIKDEGGFTYDPRKGGLIEVGKAKGYAVAIPGTEEIVGEDKDVAREDFARGVAAVIMKHQDKIAAGAVLGGWYSPERNQYMVELTDILPADDREGAILAGKQRNQEAIFDLATGETIVTGGTGDAQLELPVDRDGTPQFSTFVGTPSPEQIAAAKYYTGPGYVPLNNALRFGGEMPKPVQARMRELDAAVAKSVVKQDTTVYRGVVGGAWLPHNLAPGTLIEDRGYMSTATDPTGQYGGDTKMIIRVPRGAHALDLFGHGLTHHADEKELLLPRNTALRVVSDVEQPGSQRVINAEVVI